MPATRLWTQISSLGPFFATVELAQDNLEDGNAGTARWASMATIVNDPSVLEQRISATRAALAQTARLELGEVEWRVAASIAHLGLVARFIAPLLAAAVVFDSVPTVGLGDAQWRPILGGPYPLSFDIQDDAGAEAGKAAAATAWSENNPYFAARFSEGILCGPVRELTEAVAEASANAPGLLWGNVVSSLGGAANMIASARPDLAVKAASFVDLLLETAPIEGAGIRAKSGRLWRRSCCLMYRLPGAGYCGDCALSPDAPKKLGG